MAPKKKKKRIDGEILNQRQKMFCEYYIANGNATQAALDAGYSQRTAYAIASGLLQKEKIKKYIDRRHREQLRKRIAKTDELLVIASDIARGHIKEQRVVVEGVGEGSSEARIIEVEMSPKDRGKVALDLYDRLKPLEDISNDVAEDNPAVNAVISALKKRKTDYDD